MAKLVFRSLAISIATLAIAPTLAHAQAWVPERGTLGLGLDYNFFTSNRVVTDKSNLNYDDAGTRGHQVTAAVEYAPVDKLAISVGLPMVALKYTGDPNKFSHKPYGGSYDDGSTHTTLTDLRAGVRYQLLDEPLALTPMLAFTVPVADYETIGNTVAGRHLKMAHLGLSMGSLIGVSTYWHLAYEFTLAEKYDQNAETKKYSQNRSDLTAAIGTKVLDYRLDLHLAADFRINHDGINFSQIETPGALPSDAIAYHDAILKEQVLLIGAGLGYAITNELEITADFRYFVEPLSRNTLNASVLAIGLAWSPQVGAKPAVDIEGGAEEGGAVGAKVRASRAAVAQRSAP